MQKKRRQWRLSGIGAAAEVTLCVLKQPLYFCSDILYNIQTLGTIIGALRLVSNLTEGNHKEENAFTNCLWYLLPGILISKDLFYIAQVTCTRTSYPHLWKVQTSQLFHGYRKIYRLDNEAMHAHTP